ncbi:MAG: RsmF rRNA methyltransferase first C-terminal domain-containing protein [Eubacteriaceae bacterium]|jgi:NOL1/NOP2/sun family putative RNA methylase|nr:RsmF rRNA methyltransferase first C-terminal domain-containing protein [Eubacteriaceae bacterium]
MELPEKFKSRMQGLLPEKDWQALAASYDRPPFKGIRTNTLKTRNEGMQRLVPFATEAVPWCPTGFYIDPEIRPGKQLAYYAGLYYVQEPTAMTPAEALDPKPGDWVLDLCAAPGGKTTQLACKLQGQGLLVANELVKNRSAILASNVERMGITNCVILNEFPERLIDNFEVAFDKILVDAPCSGEGMFRKEPAALSEWSEERVALCAARQKKILETVDRLLKPGGEMVYSTCTFAPEENEQVVAALLGTGRYQTLPVQLPGLTDHGVPAWTEEGNPAVAETLRIMPNHVQGEGHFVAKLKKTASAPVESRSAKQKNKKPMRFVSAKARELADFEDFSKAVGWSASKKDIVRYQDRLYRLPPDLELFRLSGLRVLRPGVALGTQKKGRFEPSHTLAMTLKPQTFGCCHDMKAEEEAYAYLKGEPVPAQNEKGWTLMTWNGFPLGFGKASQGTIKNHFPKGLRIYKK